MTLHRLNRVGVFSRGIARLPRIEHFLACQQLIVRPSAARARDLDGVVGWGHKTTARVARSFARKHGIPYIALEDGFLRSLRLGPREAPLSLVLDDQGIYYDASGPSRLETLLQQGETDETLLQRARHCRARIVESGVSKYNLGSETLPDDLQQGAPFVLVVDQTRDDVSITLGNADAGSFEGMLQAAFDENPGARVVVKVHPAALRNDHGGYLVQHARRLGARLLTDDIAPQRLLACARKVYVCTSQFGFEALLAQVPVVCFGMPFYAGWGLTDDRSAKPERRTRSCGLDELVASALLRYPRYLDPCSDQSCEAEPVLEHLALQRQMLQLNKKDFVCFGFSAWKRPFVRRYLWSPQGEVRFVNSPRQVRHSEGVTAVVWASRRSDEVDTWAARERVPLWHMEDGFLRSVGLGSDFTAPGSLVLDRTGVYYDPTRPSDLEILLQEHQFSAAELSRAAHLRELIVTSGISKYNADSAALDLSAAGGRAVVLVVGQVEDDASVRLGAASTVKSNAQLLAAARADHPDAFLVYKPHPDVVSGNRRGALPSEANTLYDLCVERAPLAECLAGAARVHTMTSLVGFEALLRGLRVTTHGQPFYAGWGLTEDRAPIARRTRKLALDELVAGTLLLYPRYFSWSARAFCTAEQMVEELLRARAFGTPRRSSWPARRVRGLLSSAQEWALGRGLLRAPRPGP